jgi:tetratricopeptide (TPR) repeat protein
MRVPPAVLLLLLAVAARADESPVEERYAAAAAEVREALASGDLDAVRRLAARDDLDAWLLADHLLAEGGAEAATGFASAIDDRDLLRHVEGPGRTPVDPGLRRAVDAASWAVRTGPPEEALRLLEGLQPDASVPGARVAFYRGMAFEELGRAQDAYDAYAAAGALAEQMRWWSLARTAFDSAGTLAGEALTPGAAAAALRRALEAARRQGGARVVARLLVNLAVEERALGELESAVRRYEEALPAFRLAGDLENVSIVLANLGNASLLLGRLREARAAYDEAEEVGKQVAPILVAYARVGRASLLRSLGALEDAARDAEATLDLAIAAADDRLTVAALGTLGLARRDLADFEGALEAFGRALEVAEAAEDRAAFAGTLTNMADVYQRQRDYRRAGDLLSRSIPLHEALEDRQGLVAALCTLAAVDVQRGDYAEALSHGERALRLVGDAAPTRNVSAALFNLGLVHSATGDPERARSLLERARTGFESAGSWIDAAHAWKALGDVAVEQGDLDGARLALERARAGFLDLGDGALASLALTSLGVLHVLRNEDAEAERVLALAVEEAKAAGDPLSLAGALLNQGVLAERAGELDRAAALYEESRRGALAIANDPGALDAATRLAVVELRRGRWGESQRAAREAFVGLVGQALALPMTVSARARDAHAAWRDAGLDASVALGDVEAVAWFVEAGRAASLREAMGLRGAQSDLLAPGLDKAEVASASALAKAASHHRRARIAGERVRIGETARALEEARARRRGVLESLLREEALGVRSLYPDPAPLREVQALLAADEAYVAYALTPTQALALVVQTDAARVVALGPPEPLEADADALRSVLALGDPGPPLEALGRRLVAPLAFGEGVRKVLVSPESTLCFVPFGVLFEGRTVAFVPSATTWRALGPAAARSGEGVLAVGGVVYGKHRGLLPLPASEAEARAVGTRVLVGDEATVRSLVDALRSRPRWSALHLACHGLVDGERPERSGLVLGESEADDGMLTVLDVHRARMDADLVVLSACDTGRGALFAGEGMVGLTQAFMAAGAPRVVASLWRVEDAATRALMERFYEALRSGLGTADALRSAQEGVRAEPAWRHPRYWAAWALWGRAE